MPSTPRRPTREQRKAALANESKPEVEAKAHHAILEKQPPPTVVVHREKTPQQARRATFRERYRQQKEKIAAEEAAKRTEEEQSEDVNVSIPHPGVPRVPRAATSQRVNKPPNYKLHVITALTLSAVITMLARGFTETKKSIAPAVGLK